MRCALGTVLVLALVFFAIGRRESARPSAPPAVATPPKLTLFSPPALPKRSDAPASASEIEAIRQAVEKLPKPAEGGEPAAPTLSPKELAARNADLARGLGKAMEQLEKLRARSR